jgi:hypothetical protein
MSDSQTRAPSELTRAELSHAVALTHQGASVRTLARALGLTRNAAAGLAQWAPLLVPLEPQASAPAPNTAPPTPEPTPEPDDSDVPIPAEYRDKPALRRIFVDTFRKAAS